MVQNRRQYNVTKGQIERLRNALGAAEGIKAKMPPRIYAAMVAGIQSQIADMEQELREYEELEKAEEIHLASAEDLPQVLIKARVARGYTQKDLAEKLRLKPQQIQRYEGTGYRAVSLRRLLDIMKALDLDLQADIPLRSKG
jgi:HTH-type transcriptional regulator/antitoxin HigA